MMVYRNEALEMQLRILETLLDETIGETVNVCIVCLLPEEDCMCEDHALWPLHHVIAKLRSELGLDGNS